MDIYLEAGSHNKHYEKYIKKLKSKLKDVDPIPQEAIYTGKKPYKLIIKWKTQ